MKSSFLPRFLFSIIAFLYISSNTTFAQEGSNPKFDAKIEDLETGRKIDNVIIEIYKNGSLDKTITCNDGKLSATLDNGYDYLIKIGTNDNYITKIVEYDTRDIPEDVKEKGNLSFTATISLFKKIDGLNTDAFKKPIAKIAYSELVDDMHYDEDYTRQVYGEQNKVVEEYKKMLEAEAKREAAKQKEYERLMKVGLKSFTGKNYEQARTYYEQALELYPEDINALKKIKAIEDALKNQEAALALEGEKQKQANFDKKIKEANIAISSKSYIEALAILNEANTIIPNSSITTGKINEVNEFINQEKQLNANYNTKLQEAESALVNKNYTDALALYKKASEIKPNELKPKQQITQIEAILKNLDAYNSSIAKGDEKYTSKNFNESIYDYEKALTLVPNDEYAKSKILAAKEQMALLSAESDKLASFNKFNKQGDSYYSTKDYNSAITSYNKALAIKTDSAILAKIEDSRSKLDELKQNQNKEEQFNSLVQQGDNLYSSKDLEKSKLKYEEALVINNDDKAVQSKLTLINELLAKQEAEKLKQASNLDKQAALLSDADIALNNNSYDQAIALYEEAKKINPENSSNIDNKIRDAENKKQNQINSQQSETAALAKNKELKTQQEAYTTKADSYFKKRNYKTALSYYQKANEISSTEYVTSKIAETNKNLSTKSTDVVVYTSIEEDSYEGRLIKRLEAQKQGYKKVNEKTNLQEEEKIMKENTNLQQKQSNLVKTASIDYKAIEKNQKSIDTKKEHISEINENEENLQIIKENNSKLTITKAELDKIDTENTDNNYENNVKKLAVIENNYESSMEELNSQDSKTRKDNSEKLNIQYDNSNIDDHIYENDLKIKEQKESISESNKSIEDKNQAFIKNNETTNKTYQESLSKHSSANDLTRLKNNEEIEKRKEEIANDEELKNKKEAQKRMDAQEKLNSNKNTTQVYNGQFKSKLAQDFPDGKTESVKEVKNESGEVIETITTIIIVKGNSGIEYKKTDSKWGIMYLKNGQHISKNTFNIETTIRQD